MRKSRKRTIAIVVPVTVLALAGIATAAGLTTTSATLGGGSTVVTNNCAIKVTYDMTNDVVFKAPVVGTSPGGYYLTNVQLTPTGTDCNGAQFRVTVAKSTGASIGEGTGSFASPAVLVKVPVSAFAQDVAAAYATVTTGTATVTGPAN